AEMLDGEAQPPRSARAKHQPVRSFGKVLLRQRRAELLVVDAKIVDDDAALRNAGGAAGLEDVGGLAPQGLGLPAPNRPAAKPFVFEEAEPLEVVEAVDRLARIKAQLEERVPARGGVDPERRSGRRVEVPLDDLADVGVELSLRLLGSHCHWGKPSPNNICQFA